MKAGKRNAIGLKDRTAPKEGKREVDRVPDSANRVKGRDRARVEGTLRRLQSFTEMHSHEEFIEEPLGRRDVSGIA